VSEHRRKRKGPGPDMPGKNRGSKWQTGKVWGQMSPESAVIFIARWAWSNQIKKMIKK
jgi:hypothetical protein